MYRSGDSGREECDVMARSATFNAEPDVATLLAQAEHETGLHDFGDGPLHQFRMSALLSAYPDAKLVWPHRDPAEMFGSLLEVIAMVSRYSGTPAPVDRRAFSLAMLDGFQQRVEKALADPTSDGGSVCHVGYPDLVADPAGVIRAVYRHFARSPDRAEPAVRAWLDDLGNRGDRFGGWTYDLADHGVSAGEVRERFGSYLGRFRV
jgi:hypothetical protein